MLFKEIVDGRTHGRWTTDNGPSQKLTLSTFCSGELITAKLVSSDLHLVCTALLHNENNVPKKFLVFYTCIL